MDVPGIRLASHGARRARSCRLALSLGANQLFLLVFVGAGAGHLAAQATAIVLATPFSFTANKLWAFAEAERAAAAKPGSVAARDR